MATILLHINETDNGENLTITDVTTDWGEDAVTDISNVTITITDPDGTSYDVVDEDFTAPAQSELTWTVPATDVGFTSTFDDGLYILVVTYTGVTADPVTATILLDWEMKYYDYQLVKSLPWQLDDNSFVYNEDIQTSMVFNTLKRGCQYAASVGQTTKVNNILELIEDFKLTQQ